MHAAEQHMLHQISINARGGLDWMLEGMSSLKGLSDTSWLLREVAESLSLEVFKRRIDVMLRDMF